MGCSGRRSLLGFNFEFGKLKLGCRINASASDAFTPGNILFQSLRLEPVRGSGVPVSGQHRRVPGQGPRRLLWPRQHSVGCATLSQALHLAVVRTREEIGGVNSTEWRNARNAYWQTTILALNTEVGQVVSMTHSDVPGGAGNFRIQSWRLKKDWSIEISAKAVTPSMYDPTVGPEPTDVLPAPLPGMFYAIPLGPMWAPYQIQAPANDALFPGEWTFDSDQTYTSLADGTALAHLAITGKLPVKIANDNLGDDFGPFLRDACTNILAVTKGAVYIRMSSSALHTLHQAFTEAGGHWSTFVIRAKNVFTMGRSDYQRQYEPILYGWKEGTDHHWCGARDQGRPRIPRILPGKAQRSGRMPGGDRVPRPLVSRRRAA